MIDLASVLFWVKEEIKYCENKVKLYQDLMNENIYHLDFGVYSAFLIEYRSKQYAYQEIENYIKKNAPEIAEYVERLENEQNS